MATEVGAAPAPQTTEQVTTQPKTGETSYEVTSAEAPSIETLRKVGDYEVLDSEGKKHSFKSVVEGPEATKRVLVIFIRHFFCGSCQEFIRVFVETITPDDIKKLPSTSVVVIGCGDPSLIDFYKKETNCPFKFYADPSQKLYDDLGMVRTMAPGQKAEYSKNGLLGVAVKSIVTAVSKAPLSSLAKGGDTKQVGGEFLFEPSGDGEGKKVTWCFRMEDTRNHAPLETLKAVLDPEHQILKKK